MASAQTKLPYRVDPDDPRAPPQDVWDQMSEAEREHVVALLPTETPRQRALREALAALKEAEQGLEEQRRACENAQRERDEAKGKLAEVLAELEKLKGGP